MIWNFYFSNHHGVLYYYDYDTDDALSSAKEIKTSKIYDEEQKAVVNSLQNNKNVTYN